MSGRSRPQVSSPGAATIHLSGSPTTSKVRPHDLVARATGYCVLVHTPAGNYRRRLYLSLASAERALERAISAGQQAWMTPVHLTPVGGELDA